MKNLTVANMTTTAKIKQEISEEELLILLEELQSRNPKPFTSKKNFSRQSRGNISSAKVRCKDGSKRNVSSNIGNMALSMATSYAK